MTPGDWIALASLLITTAAGVTGALRRIIHNAIKPVTDKVAQHDNDISTVKDLANSANIKVSRVEGYLAGMGRTKLPPVTPTVETPEDGGIAERPVTPTPSAPPPVLPHGSTTPRDGG